MRPILRCGLTFFILAAVSGLDARPAAQESTRLAATTGADSFGIPKLSETDLQGFAPSVREQIRAALQQAERNRTAETIGALGLVLHAYEQYDRAAACYARARQLEPSAFRWTYYLAIAHTDAGHADAAVAMLREALRLSPGEFAARLTLADLLLERGAIEESQEIYAAVLKERPSSAVAHYGLGRTLAEQGQVAAAIESYRRASEIAPRFGAAHYALALLYRKRGEADKAEAHLAEYRANQARRPPFDDPLRELIEAQKIGPYHQLERGRRLTADGRHREAIEAFERALELDASIVDAHVNLVAAYASTGEFDKAEGHYRRALALQPELPENHYNYGLLLLVQGRQDDAVQAFGRALASNPSYVDAHNNLGYLLARERKHEEAIGHFRAALAIDPAHRDAHFNLAQALQASGRGAEAIADFLYAVRIEDEKTAMYLYYLADAYARQGASDEATRYALAARERAVARGQVSLVRRIDEDLRRLKAAGIRR